MGRSRHRVLLVLVLLTAILGGIAVWALSRPDVVEGGPLAYAKGYSDRLAFTVPLDTAYSWGLAILRNSGETDVIVERVTLVDETGTIRVVGIRAVPETAADAVGFAPGFDSSAGGSVDGLVVPPGRGNGFQLVFGLAVDRPGISGFRGLRVEYRVGDTRFATTLRHVVVLCAPVEQYDECPGPPTSGPTTA
jgi:hypothetical protein